MDPVQTITVMLWAYLPRLAAGLVLLFLGLKLVNLLANLSKKIMAKNNVDESLRDFLGSVIKVTLKLALILAVAGSVGIKTASFIAILGSAGLAVGLALQGSLSHFAGGVMILLFKPFKVGDFISACGTSGTVQSIQVFQTVLLTPDNKKIIIPNAKLSNDIITNASAEPKRRVDWTFGIGYQDQISEAKALLLKLLNEDERIISDPAGPFVAVSELADSSVNFAVRAWVNSADYWGVYFDMLEKVKVHFDREKISIPYPQMDIHLDKLD
jgi:small conductance mechanosensitive channel